MANRPPLVAWMNPLPMELAPALRKLSRPEMTTQSQLFHSSRKYWT